MSVFYKLTRNGLPTFAVSFKNTCPHVVLSDLHPFESTATLRPLLLEVAGCGCRRRLRAFHPLGLCSALLPPGAAAFLSNSGSAPAPPLRLRAGHPLFRPAHRGKDRHVGRSLSAPCRPAVLRRSRFALSRGQRGD